MRSEINPFASVRWRLAGAFFVMILAMLLLTGLYILNWTESYYTKALSNDLWRESRAVAGLMRTAPQDVPGVVSQVGRGLGHRITLIRSDGKVLADSKRDYRRMPNHLDRPEVQQALTTGKGEATRSGPVHRIRMLYVTSSYGAAHKPDGVVRVSEPLSDLDAIIDAIERAFLIAGIVAVLTAALLSIKLASGITNPLESIASAARQLERGDLGARVPTQPKIARELSALASAFNRMTERLENNIDEMSRQSARMQAIFDHTDNGLLLLDSENRVKMINPAACWILDTNDNCPSAVEKMFFEGTLNRDLAGLVERVCRTQEPAALDIESISDNARAVHAYVTPIPRSDDGMDVLIVLHDVTSLWELDTISRDFVANVSHELRTPLASIKAMAETIMIRHAANPAAVPGFAESIVQEADRMTLLAEDLLDLTKIESQRRDITIKPLHLRDIVDEVFERLIGAAAEKITVSLRNEVKAHEIIQADNGSIVQVLLNLVDNAIKYTPDGGDVRVWADHTSGRVAIRVSDTGLGIPAGDIHRVFERFYRVDKARSRQFGGTGLGLAIVKHLCEQMGGSVSVKSKPGAGSTFSVLLPYTRVISYDEEQRVVGG